MKTENILLSKDGYPILTDFGLALEDKGEKFFEPRGTIMYFAPEVIEGKGYGKGIDFWSFGVLLHFLIKDDYPYAVDDIVDYGFPRAAKRKEGKYLKNSSKVSEELKDLINNLLKVKADERLGYNNFNEIKSHPFFKSMDWDKLSKK